MQAFLDELSAGERRIIRVALHPDRWTTFAAKYALTWQIVPFKTGGSNQVPAESGFYCFVVANVAMELPLVLYPLYAGETGDLRRRYKDYLRERNSHRGRDHVRKFLNVFWGEVSFAFAPLDSDAAVRRLVERDLNDALMPSFSIKDFSARVKARRGAWQ